MAYNQNAVFNGLGTFTQNLPAAGNYFVEGKSSIPTIVGGGGASALVATVNLNGSPIYTGTAGAEGFGRVTFAAAALDALTIVFTSANAVDAALNAVKSSIVISQGF